jgi:hypothetical protein
MLDHFFEDQNEDEEDDEEEVTLQDAGKTINTLQNAGNVTDVTAQPAQKKKPRRGYVRVQETWGVRDKLKAIQEAILRQEHEFK